MKILVTGFDPFGGEPINPAIESVKRLPDNIAGAEIIKLEIPTVRKKSLEKIEKAINEHNPDVILSIGQAGGRFDISIERVGINLDDFRIPDNEGNQIIDEPIFPDGENSYFQDSNIVWIDNDETLVLNKYLYHFYKIAKWGIVEGGTIQRLYNDNLKKVKISIPPLKEQQRIVSILDKFETLTNSITEGLPLAIEQSQKRYEYYRELLLNFS